MNTAPSIMNKEQAMQLLQNVAGDQVQFSDDGTYITMQMLSEDKRQSGKSEHQGKKIARVLGDGNILDGVSEELSHHIKEFRKNIEL